MNILVTINSLDDSYKKALESVFNQVWKKERLFILVVRDNCEVESLSPIQNNWQWLLWKRSGRHFAAKNMCEGIKKAGILNLDPTDIVINIDGDDTLHGNSVFQKLEKVYSNNNIWLTYGSYIRKSDGWLSKGAYKSTDDVRKTKWRATHLRTYRLGLISVVPEECYKDQDGEWLKVCVDLATMLPMIEMAGYDRIAHISKILYEYNDTLPTNDHRERRMEQGGMDRYIRSLPKLKRVDSIGYGK